MSEPVVKRGRKVVVEDYACDPTAAERSGARALLSARLEDHRKCLQTILKAGKGPKFGRSPHELLAIDRWISSLTPADAAKLGTSIEELDFLASWLAADVIVRHAPHAHWLVMRYGTGEWAVHVRQGLFTQGLVSEPPKEEQQDDTPRNRRKANRGTPNYDQFMYAAEACQRDPTLHPNVIANKRRLSRDFGIRSCQTFVLARGVNAFDERAIRTLMENPVDPRVDQRMGKTRGANREEIRTFSLMAYQTELVRCLEALSTVEDATIERLCAIVANPSWTARKNALAIVIRRRQALGLSLATQHLDLLSPYFCEPLVSALAPIRNSTVVPLLASAIEQITRRNHSLWQEGISFVQATKSLLRWSSKGNPEAAAALKMIARRWKRIPEETLRIMRRELPGFTREVAQTGGARSG